MSDFKPRPLVSSGRVTTLSDLEANLRGAVSIIGGNAYSGGSPTGAYPGAIGIDQIKNAAWITNDRKTEPYSWCVYQVHMPDMSSMDTQRLYLPGIDVLADIAGVEWGIAYGSIQSGANWSGTVTLSTCASTLTATNLAPMTTQKSSSTQTWVPPTNPKAYGMEVVVTGTAPVGAIIYDIIVTIAIKLKHVA